MVEVHMQQLFGAPPARVFAVITDHGRMGEWIDGAKVTIEKPGTPAPNGLGAVRKVSAFGPAIFEEVVRWEEPRAMDYRVIRGPLRNHLGELRFEPAPDGGTQLDYRIRFTMPWYLGGDLTARLVGSVLKRVIDKGLAGLAARMGGS
jgi:uncharacterized membrane protein